MTKPHLTVVPLEAGAGPDNPPCPACGEPLFGWIERRRGLAGPVQRCESCGLGVIGMASGAAEALADLDRQQLGDAICIVNRAALSASLGRAGWAGLNPEARHLFTVEAVRRLAAQRDQVVRKVRWSPAAGAMTMWQTLLNGVTFGHNVALGALGRGTATKARRRWRRALDALISVAAAIPCMVAALPLELAAGALGRGSVLRLKIELL